MKTTGYCQYDADITNRVEQSRKHEQQPQAWTLRHVGFCIQHMQVAKLIENYQPLEVRLLIVRDWGRLPGDLCYDLAKAGNSKWF
jgi:hypothetical protein